jgi:carbon monoxide dehydrogenase subunit G
MSITLNGRALLLAAYMSGFCIARAAGAEPPRLVQELIAHNEVLIDRPATQIWPYIIEINGWKQGNRLVHVAGERGGLGEIFASVPRDKPDGEPSNYVQTVELTPRERRTIKIYGLERGPLIGFASWELEEKDGRTRVSYHVYTEVLLPLTSVESRTTNELEEAQRRYVLDNNTRFKAELQELKRIVESKEG